LRIYRHRKPISSSGDGNITLCGVADLSSCTPSIPGGCSEKRNHAPNRCNLPVLPKAFQPRGVIRIAASRLILGLSCGSGHSALEKFEHTPLPGLFQPNYKKWWLQPYQMWSMPRRLLLGVHETKD
jgi:hypothetical protein